MNLKDKEIFISMEQLDDELLRGVVGGGPKSKGTKMTPDEDNGQENDLPGDNLTPKAGEHNVTIEFNETLDDVTRIFEQILYTINVSFNGFSGIDLTRLEMLYKYNPNSYASEEEYVKAYMAEMKQKYSDADWEKCKQEIEEEARNNYSGGQRLSLEKLIEGALNSIRENYDEGLYPDVDWEEIEQRIIQQMEEMYYRQFPQ